MATAPRLSYREVCNGHSLCKSATRGSCSHSCIWSKMNCRFENEYKIYRKLFEIVRLLRCLQYASRRSSYDFHPKREISLNEHQRPSYISVLHQQKICIKNFFPPFIIRRRTVADFGKIFATRFDIRPVKIIYANTCKTFFRMGSAI
jgi:hypothetical protein